MRQILPTRQLVLFGLIIALVVGSAVFALVELRAALTGQVYTADRALAALEARALRERFDRLSDLSRSLATRVQFREEVEKGLWDDAINRMAAVPKDFPFVEGVFLVDAPGVLRGAVPALPDLYGQSFAFREWYQGVSAAGGPYVSNVFVRAAQPQLKIIVVAVPVTRQADPTRPIAYLGFQIRLDTLLEWSKEIELGEESFAIFVDRVGAVAARPGFDINADIVSYASVSWVQAALAGESDITIAPDPVTGENHLIAYQPVEGYGWAVGISQPTATAFALRDQTLATAGAVSVLIIDLAIILVIAVIRSFARLQEAKNEFIVIATHQLKTPLVGLRWTLDSLRLPPEVLTKQQQTYLDNLKRFGDMMVRSVDELLSVSRIELGTLQMDVAPTEIRPLFARLLADMENYAVVRGHTVELTLAGDIPSTVEMDEKMVYHVLQNLVSNAVDYSAPGTPVRIHGIRDDRVIRVEVENQGDSIAPEAQGHLFEKFYRAPQAKRVKAAGTGIGLYIAKSFAERWGGRIGFTSSAGVTVFWITIPLQTNPREGDIKPHLSAPAVPKP